jgi:hypothetical protein
MKKIYLSVTAVTLLLLGLVFSLAPAAYAAGLGADLSNPGLLHVMRAFGGFYLGFAAFLGLALYRKNWMDTAIMAVVLVMAGVIVGRLASLMMDGLPGPRLWLSLGIELIFAVWGLIILRR